MTNLSYRQLLSDHDQIECVADEILVLAQAATPDVKAIGTRLSELAIIVADHIAQEDVLLYPQLVRDGHPGPPEIADQLETLKLDWMEYLREWPEVSIAADIDTFRAETAEVLVRLKARVRPRFGKAEPQSDSMRRRLPAMRVQRLDLDRDMVDVERMLQHVRGIVEEAVAGIA